jgi:hypothetical protein
MYCLASVLRKRNATAFSSKNTTKRGFANQREKRAGRDQNNGLPETDSKPRQENRLPAKSDHLAKARKASLAHSRRSREHAEKALIFQMFSIFPCALREMDYFVILLFCESIEV